MINGGSRVVQSVRASLVRSSFATSFTCHHSTTFLTPPLSKTSRTSSIHTSRYIDFQITKLKQYVQDGKPVRRSGIVSLLSKPDVTIHQAKELLQLAKSVDCMDTGLYNDYLRALKSNGDARVVIESIQDMENLKIEPNIRTFNTLLHLVISNASIFPGLLAKIQQKGLEFDVATYNIVMRHYFLVGNFEKSLEIESLMEKNGVAPNVITFNHLLHTWAKKANPKKCDEVLERMRARNIHPTLASYTILIQLYVNRLHDVETGLRLFSEMKAQGIVPDARPYDILIEALTARGDSQRSLELFHEMQHGGYAEGARAYSVLIDKYTKEGKFEEGWQIFTKLKEGKEPLRAELWNVFLRYFAQRGDLAQSLVIFQDMNAAGVRPATQTYNVLLSTEGMSLESKLKVWESMKQNGVERDRFTYNLMIVAFMKEDRYADSEAIFNEMSHDNVQPDPHLLITMRDVYKRAGQAEKAQAMNAAAKKLSRHNLDLRELVRSKQQKNQLQKRIDYQKDIQEVEMLLAAQQSNNPETTPLPNQATDFIQQQPATLQQSTPPVPEPSEYAEPQTQQTEPHQSEPSESQAYYSQTPNPYFSQYQPLYYVPYQTQYTPSLPPPPSSPPPPSPPSVQQGLPLRRRALNQTPPTYSPYPHTHGYWTPPGVSWPPASPFYSPFESSLPPPPSPSSSPSYSPFEPTPPFEPPFSAPPPPTESHSSSSSSIPPSEPPFPTFRPSTPSEYSTNISTNNTSNNKSPNDIQNNNIPNEEDTPMPTFSPKTSTKRYNLHPQNSPTKIPT